ncbi:DM13 domain-containing protein [Nocardia harenae]|uniref:DM13 domain-containing protein n=1 Tax=Nocardia harenae TaxID=358707 RepID=UPI000830C923|nr:DM13 domain-containing protein [Nocardia harenae]
MSRIRALARTPLTWAVTAVALLGVVAGLALFQPWRLVTNTTVNEAAPVLPSTGSGVPDVQPRLLARGDLIAHEHGTTGSAAVIALPDGSRVLRLENLDTSDGPDLHVWLTDAPVLLGRDGWFVFDDGAHTDLGALKGNRGNQNYPIPPQTDLAAVTSVTIWCDRFDVSFGAAELRPV